MARICVNYICNVLTGDDSTSYRRQGATIEPQITIPRFRARLSVDEARAIACAIQEAVQVAENPDAKLPV